MNTKSIFKFLEDYGFAVSINMSDTFGYACAESTDVAVEDIKKLIEVEEKYGSDGVTAFCSIIEGCNVIEPLRTKKYYAAKKYLKDYKFMGLDYNYMDKSYQSLLREIQERIAEKDKKRKLEKEKLEQISIVNPDPVGFIERIINLFRKKK